LYTISAWLPFDSQRNTLSVLNFSSWSSKLLSFAASIDIIAYYKSTDAVASNPPLVVVEERFTDIIVKLFKCTVVNMKALYKCLIHSNLLSFHETFFFLKPGHISAVKENIKADNRDRTHLSTQIT